jgi:hypothetical protein
MLKNSLIVVNTQAREKVVKKYMRENITVIIVEGGSKAWNPTTKFLGHSDTYSLQKPKKTNTEEHAKKKTK